VAQLNDTFSAFMQLKLRKIHHCSLLLRNCHSVSTDFVLEFSY